MDELPRFGCTVLWQAGVELREWRTVQPDMRPLHVAVSISIYLFMNISNEFCPITTSVKSHLVTLVGDVVCFLLLLRQAPLHLFNLPLEGAAKAGISPVATSGTSHSATSVV